MVVVVAVSRDVSVQTIVIVGCVCGALVVLLCIVLAVVCCRRRCLVQSTNRLDMLLLSGAPDRKPYCSPYTFCLPIWFISRIEGRTTTRTFGFVWL